MHEYKAGYSAHNFFYNLPVMEDLILRSMGSYKASSQGVHYDYLKKVIAMIEDLGYKYILNLKAISFDTKQRCQIFVLEITHNPDLAPFLREELTRLGVDFRPAGPRSTTVRTPDFSRIQKQSQLVEVFEVKLKKVVEPLVESQKQKPISIPQKEKQVISVPEKEARVKTENLSLVETPFPESLELEREIDVRVWWKDVLRKLRAEGFFYSEYKLNQKIVSRNGSLKRGMVRYGCLTEFLNDFLSALKKADVREEQIIVSKGGKPGVTVVCIVFGERIYSTKTTRFREQIGLMGATEKELVEEIMARSKKSSNIVKKILAQHLEFIRRK